MIAPPLLIDLKLIALLPSVWETVVKLRMQTGGLGVGDTMISPFPLSRFRIVDLIALILQSITHPLKRKYNSLHLKFNTIMLLHSPHFHCVTRHSLLNVLNWQEELRSGLPVATSHLDPRKRKGPMNANSI